MSNRLAGRMKTDWAPPEPLAGYLCLGPDETHVLTWCRCASLSPRRSSRLSRADRPPTGRISRLIPHFCWPNIWERPWRGTLGRKLHEACGRIAVGGFHSSLFSHLYQTLIVRAHWRVTRRRCAFLFPVKRGNSETTNIPVKVRQKSKQTISRLPNLVSLLEEAISIDERWKTIRKLHMRQVVQPIENSRNGRFRRVSLRDSILTVEWSHVGPCQKGRSIKPESLTVNVPLLARRTFCFAIHVKLHFAEIAIKAILRWASVLLSTIVWLCESIERRLKIQMLWRRI